MTHDLRQWSGIMIACVCVFTVGAIFSRGCQQQELSMEMVSLFPLAVRR